MFVGDEARDGSPLVPWPADRPLPQWSDPEPSDANDDAPPGTGCLPYFSVMVAIMALYDEIGLSPRMGNLLLVGGPVIAIALYLWNTVRDEDVARADLRSETPLALVRTWLRRILRIRVR